MPELPDVVVYVERLADYTVGHVLQRVRLRSPYVLRTVDPPIFDVEGTRVESVKRLGKRIVLGFESELFLVLHLMIAGRLRWRETGVKLPGKGAHAAFDFDHGTLLLTDRWLRCGCAAALGALASTARSLARNPA